MLLSLCVYKLSALDTVNQINVNSFSEMSTKGPATRNDFVNDIVDDARADAIFATLNSDLPTLIYACVSISGFSRFGIT